MSGGVRALRRVARSVVETEPRCELCSAGLAEEHGHIADVQQRRLLCACRACTLLFAPGGAGGARYRVVTGEIRRLVGDELSAEAWAELGVPVEVVFFLGRSDGSVTACYPGPAGVVESDVDSRVWQGLVETAPGFGAAVPDVEAVMVRRGPDGASQDCWVLPVDRCYELVGLVREWWSGPGGGTEVWPRLDSWFEDLDRAAVGGPRGATS